MLTLLLRKGPNINSSITKNNHVANSLVDNRPRKKKVKDTTTDGDERPM